MLKVWQVNPACRFTFFRSRLSAPHAVIGKSVSQVAQCDLRSEFRGEPRQAVRALPRALAATDANHSERIEGEAVAIVHALMFAFCSMPVKRLPDGHHSRFKHQRQDGMADDEGGIIADLDCDRSTVGGQPARGASKGLVGGWPHADCRRGL